MKEKEYAMRLTLLQQQARQIEEHINSIDLQIGEMVGVLESVDAIVKTDLNDQSIMLGQIGRGIYTRTKLLEKKLFVNVGANVIVRKAPEELALILKNQITELQKVRGNLADDLKKIIEVIQYLANQDLLKK